MPTALVARERNLTSMTILEVDAVARPRTTTAAHRTARLAYIDNLRVLLATLVVAHHVGQAYGPTGGDWPVFNPTRAPILGAFFAVNASFFMGLFFLIAGYFVPQVYERKGAAGLLKDRLLRLGLPLLFVSLVLFLPLIYATRGQGQAFGSFLISYLRQPEVGHLWFAGHLLVYTGGYVLWRRRLRRGPVPEPQHLAPLRHRHILLYVLGLAVATFVVRIAFPIDRWVYLAPFIRAEVAHVPQYLSLFILGIVAYGRDWLSQLPTKTGMTWLRIGLAAAALPYAVTMLRELGVIDLHLFAGGGLSLSALMWSTVEACICVGLCVGLLTLFRERVNHQGRLSRSLAASSYAVYVTHFFLVVALQMAFAASDLGPLTKFGVVTLLAL